MEELSSTGMFSPTSASEGRWEHCLVPAWGYAMDLGNSSQAGWAHCYACFGSGGIQP